MKKADIIVISVGGSLIAPDQIDTSFLKRFKTFIEAQVALGRRFVIITGGGKTARRYQDAARKISGLTAEDLDWLGIHATRLNGHLLRTLFRDVAHPMLIKNPNKKIITTKPIIIAAGWKPGWSTDYVAVQLAKKLGAQKLVNLSNIDYVYDKDPKTNPDAQPISEIAWYDFRKLLPESWDPGLSSPFDPIAAKEAQSMNMKVALINGKKLPQISRYLNNEKFVGTKIF